MKDDLGDRMKEYEGAHAKRRLDPLLPTIARIDGRSFSKFTKGFKKPFDTVITDAMNTTTRALVKETSADIGYVQSDEITLIWREQENPLSSMWFDWREQKLVSVLASIAAAQFNWEMIRGMIDAKPHMQVKLERVRPHFDARVWQVPNRDEATNSLLWRAQDARRNAISVYCQQHVSHKQLQGLDQSAMLEAAYANGAPHIEEAVAADDLYGRYFQRKTETKPLDEATLLRIPEKKRPTADRTFTRSTVQQIPSFGYIGGMPHPARLGLVFRDVVQAV